MPLKPGQPTPDLAVETVRHGSWRLSEARPKTFSLIVAYRGLHCRMCKPYVCEFEAKLPEFTRRGVDIIAISTDSHARAEQTWKDWGLQEIKLGYELSLDDARAWGLYVSRGIRDNEPPQFTEPGLFLVQPDRTLYYIAVNNAPWGRPVIDQVMLGIDSFLLRQTPARGEL